MRGARALSIFVTLAFVVSACGGGATPPLPSPGATQAQADPCKRVTFEVQTYMAQIQRTGKLKAGVREDTPPFGRKNPQTNKFEGFDVDLVRELGKAIFNVGDEKIDDCVEWTPVVSATRIPSLNENKIDIVAATMTITEDRRKQIDFSDVYFQAGQRILVKKDNTSINKPEDMNGKTVCAATGSTSEQNITKVAPQAKKLLLASYAECLTQMQQGRSDAISTDDAILFGLVLQDPNTKVVGPAFTKEPYGLGFKKGRTGFVDFVNRLLAKWLTDGTVKKLYDKHIKSLSGVEWSVPPPYSP